MRRTALKAAEHGCYYCSDKHDTSSVEFWARAVVDSFAFEHKQAAATGAQENVLASVPVYKLFPRYLAKILLDNACYEYVTHFVGFFTEMARCGAELPKTAHLIIALASFDVNSDAPLSAEACDLQDRARFYQSVLYQDFLRARSVARLEQARAERDQTKRDQLLDELATSAAADASTAETVNVARSILSSKLPLSQRVAYVLESADRVQLAKDWAALDGLSALAPFVSVHLTFSDVTWADFMVGARLILDQKQVHKIINPVSKSIVELLASLLCDSWGELVCREAAAARCDARHWIRRAQTALQVIIIVVLSCCQFCTCVRGYSIQAHMCKRVGGCGSVWRDVLLVC